MNEKSQRAKPIVRRPGGKTRLLKHILPLITPHVCYCEEFFGGGAVLFAKERASTEVINDIDDNLVTLYRNLQYHLPALVEEIQWLFSSRTNLHDFIAQPGLTEIQRAARFLLVNRTCFGGNMHSLGVSKTKGGGIGFERKQVSELIGRAHDRLSGVVVEKLPYERCFKNYDSRDTFHFIDPPYLGSKVNAYQGWTESDLRMFRKHVDQLKGNFVITLDDSRFNRELFADLKIQPVVTQNRSVNVRTAARQTFGELIITKP